MIDALALDLGVLAGALALDLLIGEPPNALHPVVWMGRIVRLLKRVAPARGRAAQLAWGTLVAVLVPLGFAAAAAGLLAALAGSPLVAALVAMPLFKASFALRALGDAASGVARPLSAGDLAAARHGLRSLCSRDPSRLAAPLVAAAAVESVAENASDSFVAPLFYFALFGLPGAIAYRAVNTLDAMIGYHGRYEYLGKPAARLDDLLNVIPARLTAALLLAAGWWQHADAAAGWRVWRRDASATESPNAGRPMATMAGLLGVELEKLGHYRLGDARRALGPERIDEAWAIVAGAAALTALGTTLLLVLKHG